MAGFTLLLLTFTLLVGLVLLIAAQAHLTLLIFSNICMILLSLAVLMMKFSFRVITLIFCLFEKLMKKLAGDFLGGSNDEEGGDDNGGGDDNDDGGDDDDDDDRHESEEEENDSEEEENELEGDCTDDVSKSKSTSPSPSPSTSAVSQDTEKVEKQAYLLVISENENSSELMLRIAEKPERSEKSDYQVLERTYVAYQLKDGHMICYQKEILDMLIGSIRRPIELPHV